MGTFADDTAIFATHADPTTASRNLREHLLTIQNWLQKWKIKVNEIIVFCMLYVFFWVIPRRLNFICRRFGTLCLFHLHTLMIHLRPEQMWTCNVTLQVHTCSGRNRIISLMRRPNIDSTPNKPVTFRVTNF